jgi:hypothetical protein
MKKVLILALTVISFRTYSAIWDPHEKVIMTILSRAERTPEAVLNRKYSNIEQFRVDRAHFEANDECGDQAHQLGGLTKYTTRQLERFKCLIQ